MSARDDLQETLDQTAAAIARVENNPRPWLDRIVYLLNQLEIRSMDTDPSHQQDYQAMLAALREAIKNRLDTGGW